MKKTDRRNRANKKTQEQQVIFSLKNYKFMFLGFVLIFIGFTIMALDNNINGFLSLYISPWVLFSGFLAFGYGILAPKELDGAKEVNSN